MYSAMWRAVRCSTILVVVLAGLSSGPVDDDGRARFTVHDLRRSCAPELLRRGVAPKTVQRILGHANLTTTMKYYAAVTDKDLQSAMKRLESQAA